MEYQKFTDIGYQNKNALTHKCSFTSCYAEINDWTDHPIRKASNNCKTDSLFWWKHYIYLFLKNSDMYSGFKYLLLVRCRY
jgi:hypothetical protein